MVTSSVWNTRTKTGVLGMLIMHIVYARKPTSDERKKERKRDTLKYYFVRKSFVLVYHHNFLLHVLAMCRAHLMRLPTRRIDIFTAFGVHCNQLEIV